MHFAFFFIRIYWPLAFIVSQKYAPLLYFVFFFPSSSFLLLLSSHSCILTDALIAKVGVCSVCPQTLYATILRQPDVPYFSFNSIKWAVNGISEFRGENIKQELTSEDRNKQLICTNIRQPNSSPFRFTEKWVRSIRLPNSTIFVFASHWRFRAFDISSLTRHTELMMRL